MNSIAPNSIYFRLRDARAEARELERKAEAPDTAEAAGEADTGPPLPWRTVRTLAQQGLTDTAKDLELATWLTEALVRAAGLRGLATGATVIAGLIERFWDNLYPTPDEDGIETRVAPLAGLSGQGADGSLMQPLRKTILFRRPPSKIPYYYWQYELARGFAGVRDPVRRQQVLEAFNDVEAEMRQADSADWSVLRAEISGALGAWGRMARVLDERAGDASPSTSRVRDLLIEMEAVTARFAPQEKVEFEAITMQGRLAEAPVHGVTAAPSGIARREQALLQLGEVAAWFRQNEPHSPLAYTLDDAIRRGRMTWPELIAELLPDPSSRNTLLTSLGIKPPDDPV